MKIVWRTFMSFHRAMTAFGGGVCFVVLISLILSMFGIVLSTLPWINYGAAIVGMIVGWWLGGDHNNKFVDFSKE
jgi:membrane associated rhomboid family serine protease